jgi:hypothetical protein
VAADPLGVHDRLADELDGDADGGGGLVVGHHDTRTRLFGGVEDEHSWIPWGSMRALFIGGATTEFKLGPEVEAIVSEARARGVWVHSRVNSLRRLAYAAAIGCDSIDGTKWVRFRNTYLSSGLYACASGVQLRLTDTSGR